METPSKEEISTAIVLNEKGNNKHSNSLIESKQEYSLLEKKMIYFIINQIDSSLNIQEDLFKDKYFKIPVSAFGEDYSFKSLKVAINKITTRSITGGNNKKQHAFSLNPIPWAEIKEGFVTLKVQKEAMPLFLDLKIRGYSYYALKEALSLTSVYSQRLYELLTKFKNTGRWNVDIDKFKFLLGIDKQKSFNGAAANSNLKVWVIEPAMKELAEKTEIKFDYSFQKESRKFVGITFYIHPKNSQQDIASKEKNERAEQFLEDYNNEKPGRQMVFLETALLDYKFTSEQKSKILNNDIFKEKFLEVHLKIKDGTIEIRTNSTSYMAGILLKLGWK